MSKRVLYGEVAFSTDQNQVAHRYQANFHKREAKRQINFAHFVEIFTLKQKNRQSCIQGLNQHAIQYISECETRQHDV